MGNKWIGYITMFSGSFIRYKLVLTKMNIMHPTPYTLNVVMKYKNSLTFGG